MVMLAALDMVIMELELLGQVSRCDAGCSFCGRILLHGHATVATCCASRGSWLACGSGLLGALELEWAKVVYLGALLDLERVVGAILEAVRRSPDVLAAGRRVGKSRDGGEIFWVLMKALG